MRNKNSKINFARHGSRKINNNKIGITRSFLFFIGIFFFINTLIGCTPSQTSVSKSGFYFDTIITITLYGTRDTTYIDHCFDLAKEYENKFSNTITTSEISQINAHAGKSKVEISKDTIELLNAGLKYGELSKGAFDVTIGNLSDLWNFSEEANAAEKNDHKASASILPSQGELLECIKHVDYTNLEITDNAAYLKDIKSKIDVGGIAKGYIADQMKEYLNAQGITSGIINLGGNILTLGEKPDGSYYTIGIKRPFDEKGAAMATVQIKDQSVVTSGIYERYYKVDGKLYHHILDINTGYPYDNHLYSVTIISDSSRDGDALSTSCFALGLEEGMKLIEALENTEAIFITDDLELHSSSGIGTQIPLKKNQP